jgi:PHP family Zn ribbon phosphoesterase
VVNSIAFSRQEARELDDLREIASRPSGARFRLADLQLHTPVDRNFRPGTHLDTDDQRTAFAVAYIGTVVAKGLGIIALTEHNDVSWIERLRQAAADASADVVIFPGFEIASSEGVHVLSIFEPDEDVSRLEEILVEAGLPSDLRWHDDGTPRTSKLPLAELVDFIDARGGLCILSHVDREDGVLHRLSGEPRIRAWQDSGALAVQCAKNPRSMDDSFIRRVLLNEEGNYRRSRPYASIQTSDARTLDEIGSKPTFIKMSSDSLEGLRQAFLDPGSRVRFPDELDTKPYPKILAAQWDGSFLDAAEPLNPNLNCVIGGKGTAKSTVVESIRHAFGCEIPSEDVRTQAESLLNETFPSSAKLSLLVEVPQPQPTRYLIEKTGREQPVVREADSGQLIEGLQPLDLFRPIIFGQKEIYETALRIESQLELLDSYCNEELQPDLRAEKEGEDEIGRLSERLRRESSSLAQMDDRLSELPILREKKRLAEQAGLSEKLEEQTQLERERGLLDAAQRVLEQNARTLEQVRTQAAPQAQTLPAVGTTPNADLVGDVARVVGEVDTAWGTATSEVEEAIARARGELATLRRSWQERFDDRRAAFEEAVASVAGEHGEENVRDYLQLDARIDELVALEAERAKKREASAEILRQRREAVVALREVRRKLFQVRERTGGELSKQLEGVVRVTVVHQGNRAAVIAFLRDLRSGAGHRQLEQLVNRDDFSPSRLAEVARDGADALMAEYEVASNVAQQAVRALSPELIDKLETMRLDDLVAISLNLGTPERPDFRTLDRLSAGQRSTAILLLALLESDGPLILDQPEDDLDNRFIYEDVVKRLRASKEQRQFVIATHNANIPVLGDAEQILVLDAEVENDRLHAFVLTQGSIDDKELHGPLEDVLEGGREAFEKRKDKYGF